MNARDLIRDIYASGEMDPHAVAVKAVDSADGDQLREFALAGASYLARLSVHQRRSVAPPTDQGEIDTHSQSVGGGRWLQAAKTAWDLAEPYSTEDEWKPLGDCTRVDVRYIAEKYEERSAANASKAKRFRALERAMVRAGVQTVAELAERRSA